MARAACNNNHAHMYAWLAWSIEDGCCKQAAKHYREQLGSLKAISYSLRCYLDTQAFTKTSGLQIVSRALDSVLLAVLQTLATPFGDCVITPLVLEVSQQKRILNKYKKQLKLKK